MILHRDTAKCITTFQKDLNNKKPGSYYLNQDAKLSSFLNSNKEILRNSIKDNQSVQTPSSEEHVASNEQTAERNSVELQKIKKMEWFLQTKNSYDHIKVNQDAPEINELLPAIDDEAIRKWWYFSAEDYKPFETQ